MTKGVIYVAPTDNVQWVAEVMRKNDIDSVIVMEKKKGVGIVTEMDIIGKVVAEGRDPKTTKISEIMSSPLVTVSPDADIDDAVKRMVEANVKKLVVTQDNRIVGILTDFDLLQVEPAVHTLIREHSQWDIADIVSPVGTISGICETCDNYSENMVNVNGRLLCDECAKA